MPLYSLGQLARRRQAAGGPGHGQIEIAYCKIVGGIHHNVQRLEAVFFRLFAHEVRDAAFS
jgi:hypothetical protein